MRVARARAKSSSISRLSRNLKFSADTSSGVSFASRSRERGPIRLSVAKAEVTSVATQLASSAASFR
jgi:hypothetical protein